MAKSTGRNVGSINLRGKRFLVLSCRCCEAIDLRPKYAAIEASREMREGLGGLR
jgi:hypothetical protein